MKKMVNLRNGIIGILLLISLLVIFVPYFFLNPPTAEFNVLTIPNKPPSPSVEQLATGLAISSQSFKLPLSPAQAWLLQVADFKENSQALSLVQILRQKGYKAYARRMTIATGLMRHSDQVTRVFIGPELKLTQIKTLATRLTKEMQLNAKVTAFDPLLL
jgi:cell division septation protein DedD